MLWFRDKHSADCEEATQVDKIFECDTARTANADQRGDHDPFASFLMLDVAPLVLPRMFVRVNGLDIMNWPVRFSAFTGACRIPS